MEMSATTSLQESLDMLMSDTAATYTQALANLQAWLEESPNQHRADNDPDIYAAIASVLMKFMRKQVFLLEKAGGRKMTPKVDGAVLLQRVVKQAVEAGRRARPPKLAKVQKKVWEHVNFMLQYERAYPPFLPYYCRVGQFMAEGSAQGYLSDLRGDALTQILQGLVLKVGPEARSAGLEAAAAICLHADGDPVAAVPWVCDTVAEILGHTQKLAHPAAACLAAVAQRCPFAYRDWLLTHDNAHKVAAAATTAWQGSPSTADHLEVALRVALDFGVPIAPEDASTLLPLAATALANRVRADGLDQGSHRLMGVARLADLLAALLLSAAGADAAGAAQRLCGHLEQQAVAPWALCAVRLCEREGRALVGTEPFAVLFDALAARSEGVARALADPIAVHWALAAATTAKLLAESDTAGGRAAVPLELSVCRLGRSCLLAPEAVDAAPLATSEPDADDAWPPRLQRLFQSKLDALAAGAPAPHFAGLAPLLALLPLALPPPPSGGGEAAARQLLELAQGGRLAGLFAHPESAAVTLPLAALRRHRPDAAAQRELCRLLAGEEVAARLALLRLCGGDQRGGGVGRRRAEAAALPLTSGASADEEMIHCAPDPADDEEPSTPGEAPESWLRGCRQAAMWTAEVHKVAAMLQPGAGAPPAAALADDLRLRRLAEAAALQDEGGPAAPLDWRRALGAQARLPERLASMPAYVAAADAFLAQAEAFMALPIEEAAREPGRTAQLLAAMRVVLHLPQGQVCDAASADNPIGEAIFIVSQSFDQKGADGAWVGFLSERLRAVADRSKQVRDVLQRHGWAAGAQFAGPPDRPALLGDLHAAAKQHRGWPVAFGHCLLRLLDVAAACLTRAGGTGARSSTAGMLAEFTRLLQTLSHLKLREVSATGAEALGRCAALADAACAAWGPLGAAHAGSRGAPVPSDWGFDGRRGGPTARQDASSAPPLPQLLRLLVAAACFQPGNLGGTRAAAVDVMRQHLLRLARGEPSSAVPALRLALIELAAQDFPAPALEALAEVWCALSDPVSPSELEEVLECALRLTELAERSHTLSQALLRRLWVAAHDAGAPRLLALCGRARGELAALTPRGKTTLAVLLTRTLTSLRAMVEFRTVTEAVMDICAATVPDVILKDPSFEVRMSAGVACTAALFELFDNDQVFPEFEELLESLMAGGAAADRPVPSAVLAAVRVLMEVCRVDGYMGRVLPQLCALPGGARRLAGLALEALDRAVLGPRRAGRPPRLPALFRTQLLAAYLRRGYRLADFPFESLGLEQPPWQAVDGSAAGSGDQLAAVVAAMVLSERETDQIADLAAGYGRVIAPSEFQRRMFVPLAGTLLATRRGLEGVRHYLPTPVELQLQTQAPHILAFAFQLPFLTVGMAGEIRGEEVFTRLQELGPEAPWTDLQTLVSRHFRFLLAHLDRALRTWSRWSPRAAVALLRGFARYCRQLNGSRVRLLLPLLHRQRGALPREMHGELCTVISEVVAAAAPVGLQSLVLHQDVSLSELLAAVARAWALQPHQDDGDSARVDAGTCPALTALLAVLRGLCRASAAPAPAGRPLETGAGWLRQHVEALLPRLRPPARERLAVAAQELARAAAAPPDPAAARPAKRPRRAASAAAVAHEDLQGGAAAAGDASSPLGAVAAPRAALAWGPPPAPDLGTVLACLPEARPGAPPAAPAADEPEPGLAMSQFLRLVSQPALAQQVAQDDTLAEAVAKTIARMPPADAASIGLEVDPCALEASLYHAVQPPTDGAARPPPGIDDLICGGALLGASFLQGHASPQVRRFAYAALAHLAAQRAVFDRARKTLSSMLDARHLCMEDLAEVLKAEVQGAAPARASSGDQLGAQAGGAEGEAAWRVAAAAASTREASGFFDWVRVQALKMWAAVKERQASTLMDVCAPLVWRVDWFAERMLIFAVLKAADSPQSGAAVAKALAEFFQADGEATRAQCVIRALEFARLYQTRKRQRAVPHFPADSEDPFWSSLDLCAVAASASRVGWARDGLLYLELHLARRHPELPIGQTLTAATERVGVDELFQEPTREVGLIHGLAQHLPDDSLLYGVSQWCHISSRLVRAELEQDHLATLRLHSDLREFALESQAGRPADEDESARGLDDALAKLGLHAVLAGTAAPAEGASSAIWERRLESLWRLRRWDTAPSTHDGFNAQLHASLSSLALPEPGARGVARAAAVAVERPLLNLVKDVTARLHARSPEHFRRGAVQLQMLGSVLSLLESASQDSGRGGASAPSTSVSGLAASWAAAASRTTASAQRFGLLEPLHALRAVLLALAAPPADELRFLVSFAGFARGAAQTHRALGLLERAHRIAAGAPRSDVLLLHWERAQCLWELKQAHEALVIARAVTAEASRRAAQATAAPEDRRWAAQALSTTGHWLSVARLEGPDTIRKNYLEPAVTLDPSDDHSRRQLADFLDERLGEEVARQASVEHAMARDLYQRTERELEAVTQAEAKLGTPRTQEEVSELRALQEQKATLTKQFRMDEARFKLEKDRVKSLAVSCAQQFGQCLLEGRGGNLTKIACRFLSLWFDYSEECPEITQVVRAATPKLSVSPLTPFVYQLASRLDEYDQGSPPLHLAFQQTLDDLLVRVVQRSSHSLWPLLQLRNGAKVPKDMRNASQHVADQRKIAAAERVLARLKHDEAVRPALQAVEVLSRFYLQVALLEVDKKNRDAEVPLTSVDSFAQVRKLLSSGAQVPIPTAPPPESGGPAPHIHSFHETFGVAKQGVSAPKIVRLRAADGVEHKQAVKGKDDLRQDAVMQQLFRLINDVFVEHPASRQAELQLRTFQVVPLSPAAGILEWVTGTATLGEILTGNTNPTEGAHHRYRPQDWTHYACRKHMAEARQQYDGGEAGALRKAFNEVYERFKPVMRLIFLERYPSPDAWHRARRQYARSTAVSSIVGYVAGIGDRHPNNVLFDQYTGELVHIDFGITFDQGRALRVPEVVPFRLTRDMVDGLGCLGTCGLFRRCSETTLEVLSESSALVTAVVEVFVHDPVFTWSLSWKKKARQEEAQDAIEQAAGGAAGRRANKGATTTSPPSRQPGRPPELEGNEMARRALLAVKGKLLGAHDVATAALGVSAHVGWLLHQAMDPEFLSRMYFGWSPWL